ncbi:MAG: cytochrome c [Leptospiraceae bacterium]|nr:cytochrome c [Leptospiraceae bacterium]MCP5495006.1 cytochrome c [Leptospiraceae bacterium]
MIRVVLVINILLLLFVGCSDEQKEPKPDVKDILKPKIPPKISVPIGEALYIQNGCSACHGTNGDGNGTKVLNPKPGNLQDVSQYKMGSSVKNIAKSIAKGIPDSQMVGYPQISQKERIAIAKHIKKMQRK